MDKTLKSYLPVIFIALGAALGFTARSLNLDPPVSQLTIFQTAQRQTVLVDTGSGKGSAVIVKRRNQQGATRWFAVTAAHVVEKQKEVKIKVFLRTEARRVGEVTYTARVLHTDPRMDLALLFVDAPQDAFLAATFASETPCKPGDPVFTVGNFLGESFEGSISTGIISQIGVNAGERWYVLDQTTSPVYPGSSGGPAFDSSGRVVGIVVARVDSTLAFFVPIRAVMEWATNGGFLWVVRGEQCPSDKAGKWLQPLPVAPKLEEPGCSN